MMIAYCGLDCSQCDGYLATQAGDEEGLAKVAQKWSQQFHAEVMPEHVVCDGCKSSGRKSFHCANTCEIRKCAVARDVGTCIECRDFACKPLEFVLNFAPQARENLDKLKS
jgi:hypothetical protein